MNIAFWSEDRGCGTTSSMAAVASVCSNAWNLKTILMQSRHQDGDLWEKIETAPLGMVSEDGMSRALDGLDYLLWQAKNKKLTEAAVLDSMIPVVKERMYYLPQSRYRKPRVYARSLKQGMWQIIRYAQRVSDVVFIDCGSGRNELAEIILAKADVVVICLRQERGSLERYFGKRHAFSGKVIYIVDQYQQESMYNQAYLRRVYRIGDDELGVIPHNSIFRHASDRGRTERFVRRHIRGTSLENQYYFMQELMQTTRLILKNAGIEG